MEDEWIYERYYNWQLVVVKVDYKIFTKNFGPLRRYLILSKLDNSELLNELSMLQLDALNFTLTIKDFGGSSKCSCESLIINGVRVSEVDDSARMLNRYTFVIDLKLEVDVLWSKMKSDNQRVCRRNAMAGMIFEFTRSPPVSILDIFFIRYKKLAVEKQLTIPSEKIIKQMFKEGRLCIYFMKEGIKICTIALVYSAGLTSILLYVVPSERKNDGSAQSLQWNIIKHLKSAGQRWYDLGGVSDLSDKNGIFRFKRSIGGECVDLGPEYNYSPKALLILKKCYKKLVSLV